MTLFTLTTEESNPLQQNTLCGSKPSQKYLQEVMEAWNIRQIFGNSSVASCQLRSIKPQRETEFVYFVERGFQSHSGQQQAPHGP